MEMVLSSTDQPPEAWTAMLLLQMIQLEIYPIRSQSAVPSISSIEHPLLSSVNFTKPMDLRGLIFT